MTRDEAYQKALDYYKGDDLAARVLIGKYCINDGENWHEATWDDVAKRVAKSINHKYGSEEDYLWLLQNKYFIPGGRGLFAIGNPYNRASIANCYYIPITEDSIEGIFEAAKRAARTYSYGGGVGLTLDLLRPKGSPTANAAKASTGIVPFMELFSKTTGIIGMEGRRGAQLLAINIAHPDVEDVIEAKKKGHDIKFANVSVIVTDKFMKVLEKDGDWDLWYPDLLRDYEFNDEMEKDLLNFYHRFMGIFFNDFCKKCNYNKDVKILYDEWMKLQGEYKINIIPVGWYSLYYLDRYDDYVFICEGGKLEYRRKKVYKTVKARDLWRKIAESAWDSAEPGVVFMDTIKKRTAHTEAIFMEIGGLNPCQPGFATVATPQGIRRIDDIKEGDVIWSGQRWTRVVNKIPRGIKKVYRFITTAGVFVGTDNHRVISNGEKIEAKNAETIDIDVVDFDFSEIKFDAQTVMDGLVLGDGVYHKASDRIYLCIGRNDYDFFSSEISSLILKRCNWRNYYYEVKTTLDYLPRTYDRVIPEKYYKASPDIVCSFLRGIFSANGSVVGKRVTLKQSSRELIEQVQQMLSFISIRSYITVNKSHEVKFSNGVYKCKTSYDLNISIDKDKFYERIGFIQKYKMEKLKRILENKQYSGRAKATYEVVSVEYIGEYPVYDLTVEADKHTYWTGGLLVSNCGEQNLQNFSNCCLGNINLSALVVNKQIDFVLLSKIVDLSIKFLNDMMDYGVELHPLLQQKLMSYLTRRIGLGFTGLADMFLKLGVRYGSKESIEIAHSIMQAIRKQAFTTSIQLAKEFGAFPLYNKNTFKSEYIDEVLSDLDDEVKKDFEEYGIYNSNLLTVPPVGSGSIILQTSTGMEPVFAWRYTKKTESVAAGEHHVYHPYLKQYLEENNLTYEEWERSKEDYWVTAHEIDYKDRVRLQGVITHYLDSSLSSTVNLPEETTIEEIEDLYRLAHKCGCKGITIYRDGCSLGSVLKKEERTPKQIIDDYLMNSIRYKVTTPTNSLHVFINYDKDKKPLEVFINHGKAGSDEKADHEALGRVLSKALQYGCPPEEIVDTLTDITGQQVWFHKGKMYKSIPDAIGKILGDFIGKVTEAPTGKKCPMCGEYEVEKEGGCEICKACGWSKCG